MNDNKNRKNLPSRAKTIIISVILAIAVWVTVAYLNDPDTTVTISNLDIRLRGEQRLRENGLAVINKGSAPSLAVVVSGKRSDLIECLDKLYVEFDVSDITSEGEYSIAGTTSIPNTRITVEKEKYDEVTFNVETVEQKEIPVELSPKGSGKGVFIKAELAKDTVMISGAKSEIEKVGFGTAEIDLSMIKRSETMMVPYLLADSNGSLIEKNETIETPTSEVPVSCTIYNKKTLPIKLKLSPEMEEKYDLNEVKSAVSDTSVEVGVLDENHDDCVFVLITEYSDEPKEYELLEGEGMYIPNNKKKIKVKPDLTEKQPAYEEPPADGGEPPEPFDGDNSFEEREGM